MSSRGVAVRVDAGESLCGLSGRKEGGGTSRKSSTDGEMRPAATATRVSSFAGFVR